MLIVNFWLLLLLVLWLVGWILAVGFGGVHGREVVAGEGLGSSFPETLFWFLGLGRGFPACLLGRDVVLIIVLGWFCVHVCELF